uniref:Alkylated DNA repair protein AlkB homologue 8 N-terminal domain-containing protein n=1 Tax=Cyprinus carpio carpio TaxID=630221 RepID=A0A9J8CSJ6_CYPCA
MRCGNAANIFWHITNKSNKRKRAKAGAPTRQGPWAVAHSPMVSPAIVVGLSSSKDQTNYWSEVSRLAWWCSDNNLSLNVEKIKEIVVDFRRVHTQHVPLTINGATVERVSSTKFLGVHITEDLSWTDNTTALAQKSQQRLYFLRKLRRARAPAPIMCTFYRGTIESILTSCITVWYVAGNVACRKSLQCIVRAAEKIIGVSLPSLQDIYGTYLIRKILCIASDPTHPSHSFFSLLPSGRRLRSLQARTSKLKDSFIHQEAELPPDLAHPSPLLPQAPVNSEQKLFATLIRLNKLFCTTIILSALFVYYTGLHSICHMPCAGLFNFILIFIFFTCPYLYSCFLYLICIYLYFMLYC